MYNMDPKCVWENKVKKNEAKGRLGERNCSDTLVLTALTTMGKYNDRALHCSCGSQLANYFFCLQDLIFDLYANPLYERPKTWPGTWSQNCLNFSQPSILTWLMVSERNTSISRGWYYKLMYFQVCSYEGLMLCMVQIT